MCPTLNDAYLNDAYPGVDVDTDERTSANQIYRRRPGALPRSAGLKNTPVGSDRPSITRQIIRGFARFFIAVLIGVGVTLLWQSYGAAMLRSSAPSLGWLLPATPPGPAVTSAELQAELKPVALDLAIVRRSVEQLATNQDQLARKQDQLTQAFATLHAAEQAINQNNLASAPLAPKGVPVPKPKAALVPPAKPPQSSEIVIESNTSANAAGDFGRSGQFGRAFLDSDVKNLGGAAVH